MSWAKQSGIFELGDMPLSAGGVLRGARLSWHSHGTLSPAREARSANSAAQPL
jgi:homoserine O-acetyltransferase